MEILSFRIAGLSYIAEKDLNRLLLEGDNSIIRPLVTTFNNELAISLHFNDSIVGYVPKNILVCNNCRRIKKYCSCSLWHFIPLTEFIKENIDNSVISVKEIIYKNPPEIICNLIIIEDE